MCLRPELGHAGLLQKKSQDGLQTTMEATLMAQQTPAQREQVRQLQPGAVASWWQPGHPGWAIYPVDSEQFMSTGALENVNVTNEQIVAPLPMGCECLASLSGAIMFEAGLLTQLHEMHNMQAQLSSAFM